MKPLPITVPRYNVVSQYMHNQTQENWEKIESFILSHLDFETRLKLSKDADLF